MPLPRGSVRCGDSHRVEGDPVCLLVVAIQDVGQLDGDERMRSAFLVLVGGWMTSRGWAGALLHCEPEQEFVAKLARLQEIRLALKGIEEEVPRIRAELACRGQLRS